MSSAKVLVTDYAWPTLDVERSVLADVDVELVVAETGCEDELVALAGDVDAILTCWKPVTPAVLDAATRCRIVGRYGIGLDNIALEHATELGILVANVPDYCVDEVADHTIALLLALARRIVPLASRTANGGWGLHGAESIPRLRGQTLGIVGYGSIGRAVARRAAGFGLRVLAYTPRLTAADLDPVVAAAGGEVTSDLGNLLERSDWISLHLPLTAGTEGLIDAAALDRMKPSARLINTSRGAVVDEKALAAALESKRIAGAALDVLRREPPPGDHPLLRRDDVIVTPHAAFYSAAAIEELARRAAQEVARVLRGERPESLVNPAVLGRENARLR